MLEEGEGKRWMAFFSEKEKGNVEAEEEEKISPFTHDSLSAPELQSPWISNSHLHEMLKA